MTKFLRYVFYRLYKQQTRVLRDKTEAALSALIFMSVTPIALLTLIDMLVADHFAATSLFDLLGRWIFGAVAFSGVFGLQYWVFMKLIGLKSIEGEFATSSYAVVGGFVVFAYLFLPALITVLVAATLA